jgi:hypothetical protein
MTCVPFGGNPPGTSIEKTGVYIYSVTASPTSAEQVTLKNHLDTQADISGWTLGDKNDPYAYNIPQNTIIGPEGFLSFQHSTLGFQINDSGETIYLHDGIGMLVDTWQN